MCRQPTRFFEAVSQNFSLRFQREPILGIRAGDRLTHSLLLAGVHALEFIKHPTGYQHYQRYAPPPSRHDEVSPLPSGGSRTDLNASFGSFGNSCRRLAQSSSRSEEHTSELQSHLNLVCRLLLEKKKKFRKRVYVTNQIVAEPIDLFMQRDKLRGVDVPMSCLGNASREKPVVSSIVWKVHVSGYI